MGSQGHYLITAAVEKPISVIVLALRAANRGLRLAGDR
jgi:hypothetical protein